MLSGYLAVAQAPSLYNISHEILLDGRRYVGKRKSGLTTFEDGHLSDAKGAAQGESSGVINRRYGNYSQSDKGAWQRPERGRANDAPCCA